MTGGKGISACQNKSELDYAIKQVRKISRRSEIIIEEFLDGTGHGFSCILKDRKLSFFFDDNEYYWSDKFLVSGTCSPSALQEKQKKSIVSQLEAISNALSLEDGLLHAQCIATSNAAYIIEICRRTPGDMYLNFVKSRTSFDYIGGIVGGYINRPIPIENKLLDEDKFTARICIHPKKNGVIKKINLDEIQSVLKERFIWLREGDFIGDYSIEKVGIVFLSFDNEEHMISVLEEFPTYNLVEMEND